jgi:LAO/AO transport system kinase
VVNKADLVGADRVQAALEAILDMKESRPHIWMPTVVMTEAVNDKGTDRLLEAITKHLEYLETGGGLTARRQERARLEILEMVEAVVSDYIHGLENGAYLEKYVEEMVNSKLSPRRAAMKIAAELFDQIGKPEKQE